MDASNAVIGFIGGGNMAQAIIRGLLDAGHPAGRIHVADPAEAQQQALHALSPGLQVGADNAQLAERCDVLVLAVKPQIMQPVAEALQNVARPAGQVVISIAAGVTLATLAGWLGGNPALVRVMPNTPALIGAGMSGLYADPGIAADARELAGYIMAATGETLWVDDEALIDAVTAVSGSGPAYFFLVMEAMQAAGEELGLSASQAALLATRTAAGAGLLAAQSAEPVAVLRERVTSPGGTTAAAIDVLENGNLRDMFRTAMIACRDRAVELGATEPHKGS